MKRSTEIKLARELHELHKARRTYRGDSVERSPVDIYLCPDRFAAERRTIFRRAAQPVAHVSELAKRGAFVRRELAGLPLLLTRDADNVAHAFLNVCRHRGTRLVDAKQGCRHRFSCPYHAWTWDNRGRLMGVPHEQEGFPHLDRDAMGLKRVACSEHLGWIWVSAESTVAVHDELAELADDFRWFGSEQLRVVHSSVQQRTANWKLLVEGGIESYHFRVAHRKTIAPYFMDTLSSYQSFGPHLRSILARRSLSDFDDTDSWQLRDHAQILYSLFPADQILVQSDHVSWVRLEPVDRAHTQIRVTTLAAHDRLSSQSDLAHWAKNHDITLTTLNEDFAIAESIQSGLDTGANEFLTFGRFEGALALFNQAVEQHLGSE